MLSFHLLFTKVPASLLGILKIFLVTIGWRFKFAGGEGVKLDVFKNQQLLRFTVNLKVWILSLLQTLKLSFQRARYCLLINLLKSKYRQGNTVLGLSQGLTKRQQQDHFSFGEITRSIALFFAVRDLRGMNSMDVAVVCRWGTRELRILQQLWWCGAL